MSHASRRLLLYNYDTLTTNKQNMLVEGWNIELVNHLSSLAEVFKDNARLTKLIIDLHAFPKADTYIRRYHADVNKHKELLKSHDNTFWGKVVFLKKIKMSGMMESLSTDELKSVFEKHIDLFSKAAIAVACWDKLPQVTNIANRAMSRFLQDGGKPTSATDMIPAILGMLMSDEFASDTCDMVKGIMKTTDMKEIKNLLEFCGADGLCKDIDLSDDSTVVEEMGQPELEANVKSSLQSLQANANLAQPFGAIMGKMFCGVD